MRLVCVVNLLLTLAQRLNSESTAQTKEAKVELNWIEKILLFPYCLTDCSDMTKSPLDELEIMDEIGTESLEDIDASPDDIDRGLHEAIHIAESENCFKDPEELCATSTTSESGQDVEENIEDLLDSVDPVEDVLRFVAQSLLDWLRQAWDIIHVGFNSVYLMCMEFVEYIESFVQCVEYERSSSELYNSFLNTWHNVREITVATAEEVVNSLRIAPCETPLENRTMWSCMLEKLDSYVGDVNGYILATVIVFTITLVVQYFRGKGTSRTGAQNRNVSGNSNMRKDDRRMTKLNNSPRIDTVPKAHANSPVNASAVNQLKTYKTAKNSIGSPKQRTTKANLELPDNKKVVVPDNQKVSPPPRPPSPRHRPQHRLIDVGCGSIFLTAATSEVHEATDTDDLKSKTPSPKQSQSSPLPTSPVWIRYGSSPVRKHLEAKYSRNGRSASPVWERRASADDDSMRSFLQKPRTSALRSPTNVRYVPSPIYIDHSNTSFDVDIGEPCCSSSFIEECLSESGGRSRRDSGDSMHSQYLRPSVITKRYTKLKTGEFNMSHNSSAESSMMMMNVSDLNKSISLYNGDGMVFYELAFIYAFQNIFSRIRELIAWSRWARLRRSSV